MKDLALDRERMLAEHLVGRGIADKGVLEAMRSVPREEFVPMGERQFSYGDFPLPIGEGQTISQPYIVAFMAELLELRHGDRVLEIGTGSGYAAAVVGQVAGTVYTVERLATLAEKAAETLRRLHYLNIKVLVGDGTAGWPEYAPYDAIQVTAGAPHVPAALREQLAIGGRLVIPVGGHQRVQSLLRIRRLSANEYRSDDICGVQFVPLVGRDGWLDPL